MMATGRELAVTTQSERRVRAEHQHGAERRKISNHRRPARKPKRVGAGGVSVDLRTLSRKPVTSFWAVGHALPDNLRHRPFMASHGTNHWPLVSER